MTTQEITTGLINHLTKCGNAGELTVVLSYALGTEWIPVAKKLHTLGLIEKTAKGWKIVK